MILPQTVTLLDGSNTTFRANVEPIGTNVSRGRYNYTDASSHVMYSRYIELAPGQLVECDGALYFVKYIAERRLQKEVLLDVINFSSVTLMRKTTIADENLNTTETWSSIGDFPAKVEHKESGVSLKDGLLINSTKTKVTFQGTTNILSDDRVLIAANKLRVDDLDYMSAPGLVVARLSIDMRGG